MTLEPFGDTVVFLHAHPDDESISTGGTIAALAAAGARVAVLTGTRGERGEVVPGEWSALEGTDALGPHREGELAKALEALGDPAHAFLGAPANSYSDSGMRWGADGLAEAADDASPDALSLAPLESVVDEVLAGIRNLLGTVTSIVSYDAIGGYGHPDHVRMHDAGVAAARRLGVPFFAIVEPRVQPTDEPADITVDLVAAGALAAKTAAMAAHATQLSIENGDHFVLSGGQRHPIATVERFRLLT